MVRSYVYVVAGRSVARAARDRLRRPKSRPDPESHEQTLPSCSSYLRVYSWHQPFLLSSSYPSNHRCLVRRFSRSQTVFEV